MEFEYHARKAVVILEVVDPPIHQHCNILSELIVINKSITRVRNCLDITIFRSRSLSQSESWDRVRVVGVMVKVGWQ